MGTAECVGLPLGELFNDWVKEAEMDFVALPDTMPAVMLGLGLRELEGDPEGEGEGVVKSEGVEPTDREAREEYEEWGEGLALEDGVAEGDGDTSGESVATKDVVEEVEVEGEAEDAMLPVPPPPPCMEGEGDREGLGLGDLEGRGVADTDGDPVVDTVTRVLRVRVGWGLEVVVPLGDLEVEGDPVREGEAEGQWLGVMEALGDLEEEGQ